MASLFAQYILEREGKQIVEDEFGFATYLFTPDYCYIEDIFVVSEHRKGGHAARYADEITNIAKKAGKRKLLGSVSLQAAKPESSMKVLLAYGFRPINTDKNMIYFEKEIGD